MSLAIAVSWGMDEEGTLAELKGHRQALVDPKIEEHRGRIVKTTGDGMLVEFASVVDAVRCAVELQRCMNERNARLSVLRWFARAPITSPISGHSQGPSACLKGVMSRHP